MKHHRICSAALAAAMVLSLAACQSGGSESGSASSEPEAEAGVAVQIQEVAVDTISTGSSVSGQVVDDSGQESVFVSANARCTGVYVEVGDEVEAGTVLCTLDMSDTKSALNNATTSYKDTKQSYKDQEALFDAQIGLAEKSISDAEQSYKDQEALFNSQIALAEKAVSDAQKSYEEQAAFFDAQLALAEKNVSDLEALMEIGAAAQIEIDQARLNLQSVQTTRSTTLTQLETGVQSAKANLQSIQTTKSTTMAQLETGVQNAKTSLQSVQVSKSATLSQLESGMRTAESNIDQLKTVMENVDSKGNVVAPAAGKILSLNAAENSYVGPTAPVAVIDSAPRLEISVMVSESLVPRLSLQDEADVTISALDLTVTGLIQEIDEKANPQTKLYTVTLWTQEEVEGLRAGMFADVTFRTDVSTDTIVIPTEAILTTSEGQNVFVVEDGKARYVPVVTGLTGNGVTEITEGLSAGDQLVVVGQSYLTDGDPVRIVSGED
ncbi:hypothetical protein N510_002451 [Firmicutes bacterium ASF500]|nr:hypothetical protein N510_002451 [Firmicutes bacterium ASF500]